MELELKLFGVLAERAGTGMVRVEVPDGSTASDVVRAFGARHELGAGLLDSVKVAVNLEVAKPGQIVGPSDELALLPPAAGGAPAILAELRERPEVDEALRFVSTPEAGATVVFRGTVRSPSDGRSIDALEYTAYEEMAAKVMHEIATEAAEKWGLCSVAVLHAVGTLEPGQTTFVVACGAPHRGEAFEACRFMVDEVKERVPVWKKERGPWGERWTAS